MLLLRDNRGFIGQTAADFDKLKKYKIGQEYDVTITKVRSPEFHRKFFALLDFTLHHMGEDLNTSFPSVEALLDFLKLRTGYYETRVFPNMETQYIPKSISFAKMDNVKFQEFYNECTSIICSEILNDLDQRIVEKELIQFL